MGKRKNFWIVVRKWFFTGVLVLFMMMNLGCTNTNKDLTSNENGILNAGDEGNAENIDTQNGILKPEIAERLLKETSTKVLTALKEKDYVALGEYVHPEKGVRFTPYTYVSVEEDLVFTREELKDFFGQQKKYLWGHYDGSGFEIKLTPKKYDEEFIYSRDFLNAEQVGYNKVLTSGNMLENQFEVYPGAIIVEYYFSGFDPECAGLDWQSLRLVFQEHEKNWYLVGIIHNEWTI